MSAHTPGPWHIDRQCEGIFNQTCLYVCDVPVSYENAHLIAAAPDLLEALIDMVAIAQLDKWDQAVSGRQSFLWNAKVAIAKAKGETP